MIVFAWICVLFSAMSYPYLPIVGSSLGFISSFIFFREYYPVYPDYGATVGLKQQVTDTAIAAVQAVLMVIAATNFFIAASKVQGSVLWNTF
jgi:hypothetical protein